MTSVAKAAFAYTRTRALRAALLSPEDAARLSSAAGARAQTAAFHALGIDARDPGDVAGALIGRFSSDADKLVRAWPIGRALLFSIVGLLEIENLKLGFRALASKATGWARYWIDLGRVARLPLGPFRDAISLRAAVGGIARAPYGAIASQVLRAHEDDPAAAELALDRWASLRIVTEARGVAKHYPSAAELALQFVRRRDVELLLRKFPPAATALLREELRPESLRALAEWTPEAGPLKPPHRVARGAFTDGAALLLALRRAQREACLRAFIGPPFQLSAAVALLLLRLEEIRAVTALAESRWDAAEAEPSSGLDRILAASAMGA